MQKVVFMLDEFDNIEKKIEGDLDVESKATANQSKASVGKLDAEIEAQINSRKLKEVEQKSEASQKDNVKNFAKSQKQKKSLKKRVLAWALGIGIFAGAAAGATMGIKNYVDDQTTGNGAYRNAIQSRYEKVDETLTSRLCEDTTISSWRNFKINTIKFEDPTDSNVELNLYYEGDKNVKETEHFLQGRATYNVLLNYYNSLVDAEESGNMISYLDALNQVFENMDFVNCAFNEKIQSIKFEGFDEDASEKINELFSLDLEKEGVVKQVAFLPYLMEITKWGYDDKTNMYNYTFKLSGISYCETVDENSDKIEQGDDLVSDKTYNQNHIKAYYRDIEISSKILDNYWIKYDDQLKWDMYDFVNGDKTKSDFEIKTTYFEETNVFNVMKEYENMKNGNFDYQKPDNVDMSEYTK